MARKALKVVQKHPIPAVTAIALSRFECVQFKPDEGDQKPELSLDIAMTPVEEGPKEGQFFVQVMCKSWRENDPESPEAHFTAIYTVLFRSPLESIEEVTATSKETIANTAWTNFSSLFYLANGQMHAEMPSLPLAPAGIAIRPFEELVSAFDVYGEDTEDEEES